MYKNIYLDNAASSFPKPSPVIKKMNHMMKYNTANPGRSENKLSEQAAAQIFAARTEAVEFFGIPGKEENVIFTSNATHAINLALSGVLESGDHVIISDVEHNSVLRPLVFLEKFGVSFDIAETCENDEKTVGNIEKLINNKTKMIFTTHASNVSGAVLPAFLIGELCRKYDLLFGLDASQTAGHIDIDMKKLGISLLCVPGHKGLLGPQGTGMLLLALDEPLKPIIYGGTGGESLNRTQPTTLPESLESGTLNTVGICGLYEGLRFCKQNGKKYLQNIRNITEFAFDEISRLPFTEIYSPKKNNAGIISFAVGKRHSSEISAFLAADGICVRGGFHCSALFHSKAKTEENGLVRVSAGMFNNEKDIIALINSLKRLKI